MKRLLSLCLALSFAPLLATGATPARYRIDLRHGGSVYSRDLPVHKGTVVLFHQASGGALTGLPEEEVVTIQTEGSQAKARKQVTIETRSADAVVRSRVSAVETLSRPLEPGDILVIGPTGGGSDQLTAQTGNAGNATGNNAVPYNGVPAGAYGGAPTTGIVPPGMAPNGQAFATAPGDLARAASGNPPTLGPNGFPTNGNPTTVSVGPNGFPAPGTTAVQPGSNQPIGPNGFPAPGTTTMQPGGTQPVGPNGFPAPATGAPAGNAPAGTGQAPAGKAPASGSSSGTSGHP